MRSVIAFALAGVVLATCAAGSAGTTPATALTVTFWEDGIGRSEPVRWTLRCSPARGTLPRPAAACRRLAAAGPKLFSPVPRDAICTLVYGGPQVGRVVGTVAGKRVWATLTREDGCQISRWNGVSPWLLPHGGVRG